MKPDRLKKQTSNTSELYIKQTLLYAEYLPD